MDKGIWLNQYPSGVEKTINPDAYPSIINFFDSTVRKYRPKVCFSNMGTSLTFEELDHLSGNFASFLQHELGLQKGDRVAIQLPNLLQFPVVMFGILRAGLTVVNTNPLYTAPEMLHQFQDSGAKALIILSNFAHQLESILPQTKIESVIITYIGDALPFPKNILVNSVIKYVKKMVPKYNIPQAYSYLQALDIGRRKGYTDVHIGPEDIAFLQYTGGTTGVSKGAVLTQKNIVSNMLQIAAWMKPALNEGQEIIVTALPLYHIFSLTVNCLTLMNYGGHNILVTNPRDIPAFIKLLRTHKFTVMTGVNTLYNALMNHPDFGKINFSNMKVAVAGAMAMQKAVADRWQQLTGTEIFEGYGLTEASPVVCCNPVHGGGKVSTIGMPLPSTEIDIWDENGKSVGVGQPGEIAVRGPQVMRGYWQRPDETAKVIREGWLLTGDIAILQPDGFLKIVDRKKDMILISGFNVYPNEVEDVIATHPGVLEVAAVGVEDEHSGEIVKIFVVKKDPQLSAEDLIAFAKKSLTNYKVPRQVEFRSELPKTNVGKILRRELRVKKN